MPFFDSSQVGCKCGEVGLAYFAQKLAPINPNGQSTPFKNYLQEIIDKAKDETSELLERKGSSGGISWNMESDLPPVEEDPPFSVHDMIKKELQDKEDNEGNL